MIASLDDLLAVLRAAPPEGTSALAKYAASYGLRTSAGQIDGASLPTFGGETPQDTRYVWSWDETRLLVSGGAAGLRIVPRAG